MRNLTREEKIRLLVAKDRFNTDTANGKMPEIVASDGPCGLRWGLVECPQGKPSICYPSPHVLANSWDKEVIYEAGQAIASDCISKDIDIILAPGVNIKRTPLCGRNFEYWSEDPYLAGTLAAEYIKGCQGMGIGTSLKHFCGNNREYDRRFQSSDIDERTLREIYTKQFEIILKEVSPYTVMCSYNPLNGINLAENEWALKHILREKLGYDGVIISDWNSVHNRAEALNASLDIMFPFQQQGLDSLAAGYADGTINDEVIDQSVARIEKLADQVESDRKWRKAFSEEKRHEIALEAARKGMVLLKNENDILPLKAEKIAVLGNMFSYIGGGSARTNLRYTPQTLAQELKERLPNSEILSYWTFKHASCLISPALVLVRNLQRAYDLAYDADVTVLTVGTSDILETESYDRTTLKLPEALENLILEISKRTKNLVVVLEAGSAVDVSAWIDSVQAVLYAGFAGEAMNEAIADILSGKVCPSGRLSETFPMCVEDTPTGLECGYGFVDWYKEWVLVGYRWYDTKNIPVRFPFGFGLSYAKFKYSDFAVEKKNDLQYEITFTVENISEVDGGEVAQLYVRNVNKRVVRPDKELRRYQKVYLKAGEKKKISFLTDKDCFEYYSICHGDWHVDQGRYELLVCRDANTVEFSWKVKIDK